MSATWYRPPPILEPSGEPLGRGAHYQKSARRLLSGTTLCVADHYNTGVGVIKALVAALRPPLETADHAAKQTYREAYRENAYRLLAPIEAGRVALPGSPDIGFLTELYPELDAFWLPFPAVRDLGLAWHRYRLGVAMPVLGHRLHPFYGTYLPKRTEHLELFATWLSRFSGRRDLAVDVGTGSGVLAMMLARAGFGDVLATDVNPNACESVRREIARQPVPPPIRVYEQDLLGEQDILADLVVFNPPWTQGRVDNLLDRALYYEGDLFQRFFDQAYARLSPGGRVVLVFSNVIALVQPDIPHPIDEELERGRFEVVDKMARRIKPRPTDHKTARRTKERVEVWELARLARKIDS